jgi:hypothetical protein
VSWQKHAGLVGLATSAAGTVVLVSTGEVGLRSWLSVGLAAMIMALLVRYRAAHLLTPELEEEQRPPADESAGLFQMRVLINSHLNIMMDPSSEIGPEPLGIPATGHNVCLQLRVTGKSKVLIHSIHAEVVDRTPLKAEGVQLTPQPGSSHISLAPNLSDATARALERYLPLQLPHLEILLDTVPPAVRYALDSAGGLARPCPVFPVQLEPKQDLELILAPLTDDQRHVFWRLFVDVECDAHHWSHPFELQVTAETGFRVFHPGGDKVPTFSPAHELAPHWRTNSPPSTERLDWIASASGIPAAPAPSSAEHHVKPTSNVEAYNYTLAAAEDACRIYHELAKGAPGDYLPRLAQSLANLASMYDRLAAERRDEDLPNQAENVRPAARECSPPNEDSPRGSTTFRMGQ